MKLRKEPNRASSSGSGVLPRRLSRALWLETLLGGLGLYSVIPVLGVLLADRSTGSGTSVVGVGLFCYTASAGLSATLVHRWLPTLTYRRGMAGAVLLSAVAFGLLPWVGADWAMCALLLLAGFGVSVHFLLSRVLVAETVHDDLGRNRVFSLLQVAINAAAATGPFVANLLYTSDRAGALMAVVAACYAAAGVVLIARLEPGGKPPPASTTWPVSRRTLRRLALDRRMLSVVLSAGLGAFVYAQFYSAFALYVAKEFDSGLLRSVLIAGPSLCVALMQHPVTLGANRLMRAGTTPFLLLAGANLLFGAAMGLLGLGFAPLVAATLAILVFCLAEMVFGPLASSVFAGLPLDSSLESFNLRQLFWSAGEALGALAGGSLFLALYLAGDGQAYWLGLCVLTVVATGALLLLGRTASPERPTAPAGEAGGPTRPSTASAGHATTGTPGAATRRTDHTGSSD